MTLRKRVEGGIVVEGPQVTSTLSADYFYFRKGRQIVCVRMPTGDTKAKIEVMNRTIKKCEMAMA